MKSFRKSKTRISLLSAIGVMTIANCASLPKNEPGKEKVILVHGYGRSNSAMSSFKDYFEQQGYQVYSIGYSSLTQTIEGIEDEFTSKVDQQLIGVEDKVHFVGHSMGGLMIRNYLGKRHLKNLGNVVIIGSPNKGTPAVEYFKNKWYFGLAGPAVVALSSNGSPFLNSLKAPDYNLGVIAGLQSYGGTSAYMQGDHDGLVPLESTKVDGMKDFVGLPVNHYSMRFSPLVMKQVHHFLRNSVFQKAGAGI